MKIFIGIMIPFIGTILGSFTVYFFKDSMSKRVENTIIGFAAGIMIASAIWSLIIPALGMGSWSWLKVSIGLIIGMFVFILLDYILDDRNSINNLMLAITVHNIPEGMAVGIVLSSYLNGTMNLISCYSLAIGIAIQNFPEGSIVSLPLKKMGYSKNKAFLYGVISALAELLGSVVTLFFSSIVSIVMPYLLAIAAGAMIYVVVGELIPKTDSKKSVISFFIGFIIMMILDVITS